MFKIISEAEKHFLEHVLSSMIMNFLSQSSIVSLPQSSIVSQKCLALALALVDFNIFRIFVMIKLLNTTSLLIVIKLLVYLFA